MKHISSYEEEIPGILNVTCHFPVMATSSILIGRDKGNLWLSDRCFYCFNVFLH